jgi:hypothetical protein
MKEAKTYVEYSHNNSGGMDWLTSKDWKNLAEAGWKLDYFDSGKPYTATKHGVSSLREAVDEWERVTGKSSTDAGCSCCGQPHHFTFYKDGKWTDSGPRISYQASWD